jgi:hypothetical protein
VYEALDRDANRGTAVAWFQLFSLPLVFGVALSVAVTPMVGLAGIVAGTAFAVWYRRRARHREGAVLRVEEGKLLVSSRGQRLPKAVFALRDLSDVVLDVKTIRRVQEGDSPIPAVRFTHTTVGPEIDTARIVLVGKKKSERVELSEAYLAHMDATEWLGKIRVFLRKHGWIPKDERKKSVVARSGGTDPSA